VEIDKDSIMKYLHQFWTRFEHELPLVEVVEYYTILLVLRVSDGI